MKFIVLLLPLFLMACSPPIRHEHTILGEVETSLYDLIPESITNEI